MRVASSPARRRRALLAALALCAPAAGAQRLEQAELARLLLRAGAERDARPEVAEALRGLEERAQRQRAQFEDAARRPLPAKAAARLAAARAAWAAGQGQQLELLRAGSFEQAAVLGERLAAASAQEPISQGELLRVRAPRMTALGLPPAEAKDASSAAGAPEASAAPIGAIPPPIKAVADSLDGPIEAYAFVRNAIRPEFYYGSLKGALQTLYDGSGNDADSAALLIALLRAKGLPARFVTGRVELSAARLQQITGTGDGNAAVRVLERAGIPHEVQLGPGGVERVELSRVWAEAWVPYVNYRGALLDGQGQVWVPLDAGFKPLEAAQGFDVFVELGLDPLSLVDEYLHQPQAETPREFLKRRLGELLAASNRTLAEARNGRAHLAEQLGLLPATLPYKLVSRAGVSFEAPLLHRLRVRAERGGVALLDADLSVPALLGDRLTLGWEPFDEQDRATAQQYGGLAHTPPYLVDVRALLRSGGVTIAAGQAPVGKGVPFELTVELVHPGGEESLSNRVLAGNLTAIGLGGRQVAGHETQTDNAAALLARLAEEYLKRWNEADGELSDVLRVAPLRPTASACFVASDVEVEYADGDEQYPLTWDWKGVFVDADLRPSAPVAIGEPGAERAFTLWSGLEGSVQEHRVFDLWQVESVSTVKALQLAAQAGTPVLTLDASNVESQLSVLQLDARVEAEIREAALRGYTVRVPTENVTRAAWTGVGYWISDLGTGESAWQLQGGHSGGVTALAAIDWPLSALVETLSDQGEAPAPPGTAIARLVKFVSTDFQDALVDKPLPLPLRVLALDADGQRVADQPVTFVVLGGGGALLDPLTGQAAGGTLTVRTDARGEARVVYRLGRSTGEIPRFTCLEEDPESCSAAAEIYPTQIGLNLVTAYSGGAQIEAPFQSYGVPDDEFDGTFRYWYGHPIPWNYIGTANLNIVGPVTMRVVDRFDNPLSNVAVQFRFAGPPEEGIPPPGWLRARPANDSPGYLVSVRDYLDCASQIPAPAWGQCLPNEVSVLTQRSSPSGVSVYESIGSSPFSLYHFDIGTAEQPQLGRMSMGTRGGICLGGCSQAPDVLVSVDGRGVVTGSDGQSIEAREPGATAELAYVARAVYEGYTIDEVSDQQGQPHYYALGDNTWTSAPLEDSRVAVSPLTPGTNVAESPLPHVGDGLYRSELILAGQPGVNEVQAEIRSTPWEMPWLAGRGGELDPAAVDFPNQTVEKRKFPQWPFVNRGRPMRLWGVRTQIQQVQPNPVSVDSGGQVSSPASVSFGVEPPQYVAALGDWARFSFRVRRGEETVMEADGQDVTPFTIPAGLPLPTGQFTAQVEIPNVSYDTRTGFSSIVSAPYALPICSGLKLNTPVVVLPVVDDPPAGTACDLQPILRFEQCQAGRVTLLAEGQPVVARLDTLPAPVTLVDYPVGPGAHQIEFEPDFLRGRNLTSAAFLLRVVDPDTGQVRDAEGSLLASGEILELETPEVGISCIRDPASGTLCPLSTGAIVFSVCQDVSATIRVDGFPLVASLDNGPFVPLQDLPLAPGVHVAKLPPDYLASSAETFKNFEAAVAATADPSISAMKTGVIKLKEVNRPIAAVGHTMIQGVDLWDGHLALDPVTDLSLPGRHLAFNLTRMYSSAGQSSDGEFGAGWGWTYGLHLDESPTCGLVSLSSLSGSQVFRDAGGGSYEAQRGYHGSLVKDLAGPSFEYWDKANIQYHYEVSGSDPQHPTYRLAYLEEPHQPLGDRLTYVYSDNDRLDKIVEELAGPSGRTPVRELRLTYKSVLGTDRIEMAEIVALDGPSPALKVTYAYDAHGNLLTATRSGQNVGGPSLDDLVWSYKYDTADEEDRHQMVEARDPNGSVTQYQYYRQSDQFPGEPGVVIPRKPEYVKAVRHFDPREVKTSIVYDQTEAAQNRIKATVTNPRGFDSLYTMDSNGQLLQLDEPLGKQTVTTWDTANVVKLTELDAEQRLTTFGYDTKGNLTSKVITTTDLGPVTQGWSYDGTFNKKTSETDAENRQTVWDIDPANGDERSKTDAETNKTSYAHVFGLLTGTTDPRNHTTTYDLHNSYGQWTHMTDALGNETTREYDPRGRLLKESDTLGHETRVTYDAFDRETSVVRVAGGGSSDVIKTSLYYPGGEKREETSGNGARTVYTLDGLNRVTQTATYFDRGINRTRTTYDLKGNKETETNVAGVRRRHTYDALDRREGTVIEQGPAPGPVGAEAAYEYNLVDAKTAETDVQRGARTDYVLDGLYRAKEKQLPEFMPSGYGPAGRLIEKYDYDKVGNRTKLTDANGHATTFEYDDLNRLTKTVEDPSGLALTTTTRYCNEPGDPPERSGINKCEEHDGTTSLRTLFEYDELNRPTLTKVLLEGPDGEPGTADEYPTVTTYDDTAHELTVTDPRGTETLSRLDGLDRAREMVVDPSGLNLVTKTTYDGLGLKKRQTDARGNPTIFTQDGLGRTWRVTDAAGIPSYTDYFEDGQKKSETDRRGVKRTFTYDNQRRLLSEALAVVPPSVPWSHTIEYQDAARKRIETDARGKTTTYELDGLGRVKRVRDHLAQVQDTTWDGVVKRAETDKKANQTRFDYDAANRLLKTTMPAPFNGQTVVLTYLDGQNQVREKDERGIVKLTQMDSLGRVRSVTRGVGTLDEAVVERHRFDGNGNKTESANAEGKRTDFTYDAANRLVTKTDAAQCAGTPCAADVSVTTYKPDENGNVLEEKDARAAALLLPYSLKRRYDKVNRVTDEWTAENSHSIYGYDGEGNRTSKIDPNVHATTLSYDELSQLSQVTEQGGLQTRYGHDPNRNLLRSTDADGRVVASEYDDLNRRFKTTRDPGGLNLVYEVTQYDPNGNVEQEREPNGEVTVMTYDELNRLRTRTHQPFAGWTPPWRWTADELFFYDENDNLVRIEEHDVTGLDPDPPRRVTERTYDFLDRLKKETTTDAAGATRIVEYSYYKTGLVQTVTDPAGGTTSYAYDGQDRLKTVTTPAGATTHTYWPDGLLKSTAYANGTNVALGYDKADRLRNKTATKGATVVSAYVYSYDPASNRLAQYETNGGQTELTSYTYDNLDRLETVTYPADAGHPQGKRVVYGYDNAGNRRNEVTTDLATSQPIESKTGVFDLASRLTTLQDDLDPQQSTTLTWSPNGNLLATTTNGVTTSYRYDLRDGLGEVQRGPQTLTRMLHDWEMRRVHKIGDPTHQTGSGSQDYVYARQALLGVYENGQLLERYEWSNSELISLFRTQANAREYFSLDGLGSTAALTDDSGQVTSRLHLDAWGELKDPAELQTTSNRFAFTGHYFDTETGLYYAKARYLSPDLGRFITQDTFAPAYDQPISLNLYAYANANPTRYVDPDGHKVRNPRLANPGAITIDDEGDARQGALLMSDETTVYADPIKQIAHDVEQGDLDPVAGLGQGTTLLTEAYGRGTAKLWVASAAAATGGAGAGAAWTSAGLRGAPLVADIVGGATFGGTNAALDGASAEEIGKQAVAGAVLGPIIGRVARGARIGQTGTVMEPLSDIKPMPTGRSGLMDLPEPPTHARAVQRGDATYYVDDQGLPVRARATITGPHPGRGKGYRPEPVGGRPAGHHRGHLVPENAVAQPSDVNVRENMIPEAQRSNLGPKKVFENDAARRAAASSGRTEFVSDPVRAPSQTVPKAVTHYVLQDGKVVKVETILNRN